MEYPFAQSQLDVVVVVVLATVALPVAFVKSVVESIATQQPFQCCCY